LFLGLPEPGANVRRAGEATAELVLAEANVAALVLDHGAQEFRRGGVGVGGMAVEDGKLERLEDHVLGEDRRLPILAGDELEQAAAEEEQAPAGATIDLDVDVRHTEIAQSMVEHLEMARL